MRFLLTFLIFLACNVGFSSDVQFRLTDPQFGISQTTNITLYLQAENVGIAGTVTLLPFQLSQVTDTNGQTTFTNLFGSSISGFYHWTIPAPPRRVDGDIWLSSTNLGLVQATAINVVFGAPTYPAGYWSWSSQASDLRYSQSTNVLSGYVQVGQLLSTSNAIIALIPSTNGFVTAAITNGFATTNYANGTTNGFTSIVFSNATAFTTPNQVSNIVFALANTNSSFTLQTVTNVANGVYSNNPSGYVNSSITNGLASTNYVNSTTNALGQYTTTNQFNFGTNNVATNSLSNLIATNSSLTTLINIASNYLYSANQSSSNLLQSSKQPASLILTNLSQTGALTNQLSAGQNVNFSTNFSGNTITINAPNQTFLTNGLAGTNYVNSQGFVTQSVTNGLAGTNFVLNQGFVTASITNGLAGTNFVQSIIAQSNLVSLAQMNASNAAVLTSATNFSKGVTNSSVFVLTNNPQFVNAITNPSLFVAATNGNAYNLTIANNLNFGFKTNALITTNLIGIFTAGTEAANGTYRNTAFSTVWTNMFDTNYTILLSGGSWFLMQGVTTLYSSANLTNWTVVSGVAPAPFGAYGVRLLYDGVEIAGQPYYPAFYSNWVAALNQYGGFTNDGSSSGFTNLVGVVQGSPTNNGFSTLGSNIITAIAATFATNGAGATNVFLGTGNNLITVTTNSPSSWTVAGVSQTNGQTSIVYSNASIFYANSNPSNFTTFSVVTNLIQAATNGLAGGGSTNSGIAVTNGTGYGTTLNNGNSIGVTNLNVIGNTLLNNGNIQATYLQGVGLAYVVVSGTTGIFTNQNNGLYNGTYVSTTVYSGANYSSLTFTNIAGKYFSPFFGTNYIYQISGTSSGTNFSWQLLRVNDDGTSGSVYNTTNSVLLLNPAGTNAPIYPHAGQSGNVGTISFYNPSSQDQINDYQNPLYINDTNGVYINGVLVGSPTFSPPSQIAGLNQLSVTNSGTGVFTNFNGVYTLAPFSLFYPSAQYSFTNLAGSIISPTVVSGSGFSTPAYTLINSNYSISFTNLSIAGIYGNFNAASNITAIVSYLTNAPPFSPTNYLIAGSGGNRDGGLLTNIVGSVQSVFWITNQLSPLPVAVRPAICYTLAGGFFTKTNSTLDTNGWRQTIFDP